MSSHHKLLFVVFYALARATQRAIGIAEPTYRNIFQSLIADFARNNDYLLIKLNDLVHLAQFPVCEGEFVQETEFPKPVWNLVLYGEGLFIVRGPK